MNRVDEALHVELESREPVDLVKRSARLDTRALSDYVSEAAARGAHAAGEVRRDG